MAPDTRHVHVVSSLPPDQLLLQRVHATEALGRPFEFELELLSPDPHLVIDDLLGDRMSVVVALPDGERYFNGHTVQMSQAGTLGRYTRYQCTLRPFFWLLTLASDSRIYKKMSVPEIVKDVIGQFGLGSIEEHLQADYLPREYTVQYRESYFDFLSRLMEEEGIYYFFRHEKDQHIMVLCDDRASHKAVPQYERIPFIDPDVNAKPREEHFSEWTLKREVRTGAYAVNDFDFEVPRADLLAKLSRPLSHKHASFEHYDPLAGYVDALDAGNGGDTHRGERGELFARVRLEELQAEFDRDSARGNARGPHAGALFELTGHPRDDQNRELLVLGAEYLMFQPGYDAGSSSGSDPSKQEPLFEIQIEAQPSNVPFRPRRLTRRPAIPGPHTAIVVGSGEIWTDKFGRVKVHFPWDREDTEGCWLRVAQVWAGSGWGGLQVPRVGQEVIVEFMEGDPDRPIITGRVYNGTNLPPFGMPDGATKSGILSRSSKGGAAANANEISFEDKLGAEVFHMHAEKDMTTEVENDQQHSVGHDRTRSVGHDEKVDVGNDQTQTIGKNQTEKVGVHQKLDVGSNQTVAVGANQSVSVSVNRTDAVGANETRTVGGDRSRTVGGAETITVATQRTHTVGINETIAIGAAQEIAVGAVQSITVGANQSTTVGADQSNTVGGGRTSTVGKDDTLDVAKKLTITAGDEISITTGSASIVLKKDGTVTINGKDITLEGTGAITAKASKDMTLKGQKILQN